MDAIEVLKTDHRQVEQLFSQLKDGTSRANAQSIFKQIYHDLSVHAIIEEQVFYPGLARFPETAGLLKASYIEHAEMKRLLGVVSNLDINKDPTEWSEKTSKLWKEVKEHVQEEETVLFPRVSKVLNKKQLDELGQELEKAKGSKVNSDLISQPLHMPQSQPEQPQPIQ